MRVGGEGGRNRRGEGEGPGARGTEGNAETRTSKASAKLEKHVAANAEVRERESCAR